MDLVTVASTLANTMIAADPVVSYAPVGAGLAAGLAVVGAGIGIGKLAASALEGSARQPEMMGKLRGEYKKSPLYRRYWK